MGYDRIDSMYDALVSDGAQIGTRQQFKKLMLAPGKEGYRNRLGFYQAMKQDGANIGATYEDFGRALGLHSVKPKHKAKPLAQKPVQPVKKLTMKQRAQKVAAQYQQTKPFEQPKYQQTKPFEQPKYQQTKPFEQPKYQQIKPLAQNKPQQPTDYLHRPQSQMGRARRNAPGKASPFVQSLYEIDNAQNGPDYSVDYTSPKATQQVYQQNQQLRRQAAKTAGDHIVNDEYRRQSQPMIDNGTVGVMKPMGEIEQEMSDSASRFVDANLGDYINNAVLGEQNAAGKRAVDAYNNSFAAGGGGGGGINDLLMRSLAYNEENDPDRMIENLAKNARGGLEKLFQNPSFVAKVKNEADMLGVTPEAYVESMLPHLKDRLSAALEKSEYNKYLPKDAFENMTNRFIDSNTIGKLVRGATMTRGQRIMQERASAATAAGENPYYKGSTIENVVADVAGMVSDPVFKGAAGAGGKVAGKLIGNSTKLAALMANGNLAQRLMAKGAQAVTSGGVTGFVFDSTGSVIQNYSTGEDTSLGNTLKVAAKGGTTGAVNFATMSLAGIPLSEVGRSIGLKAVKGGSFWGNTGRATAKIGLESGKTYMEAMGMYLGGYVSGKLEGRTDANGKPIEFDLWNGTMESLPTAIGFRLQHAVEGLRGGRKNEKGEDMGWFGSTIANFKDFLTSDKAKESRFLMTEDERNQIFSSGAMNGLMPDGENIVSYAKRTKNKKVSYEDPYLETDASMIKNTYDQIMADPKVSWDAKAKFSAMVTGIMPSARPMMDYITFSSEDYVKDGLLRGKRKYVNEYSAKGELLSKIPYDNKVDRDNVVYKHNIVRENQRLYNAMGLLARQDRNNYELQNDFFVENMKKPGADVNILVTNMGDEGSHVFRDFSLFALNSEKGTVLKTIDSVAVRNGMKSEDLIKAMKKNPMKRTDFEQNVCVELRRALESKSFPYGKVHVEQSNLNGKDVAEDNNLGTEQPNGDAVKHELNGLRQAEEEVEVLMRDNDVFSQNFKKLQSQGLTNPQIYDWMVQQGGLTVEQLEPFAHYINANARVQGMQEATKQKIENVASSFVQDWSYKDTLNGVGMVNADGSAETVLFVYHDGKELIVGSGDVSFNQPNEYGIRRAKEDVGDMLVCFDPQTGQMVYVHASEVDYSREMKPEELKAQKILELQNINSVPYNEAAQEQAMLDAAENQDQSESGKGNDESETPEIVSEATPVETPTDFSINNGKGRINSYKATPHEKTKSDGTKEITFSSEVTFTKGAPKGHKEGEVRNIGNGGGFIKIDPIDIDYQQYAVSGRLHDDGTAFSKDEATSEDIAEAKEQIDTLLTPQLAEEMGPQYNVKKIIIAPDGRVFAKFIGMDGNIPLKRNPLEKAPQDNTTKSEDNTTNEDNLHGKDSDIIREFDTKRGKHVVVRKVYSENDKLKVTKIEAKADDGTVVSSVHEYFPLPDEYEIRPIDIETMEEVGSKVLGVNELRENKRGTYADGTALTDAGAKVVVKFEDGSIGSLDVGLIRKNEKPAEQPQPSRKFADGTEVPMATDSKGRPTPDYEKMTPEQSAEILTEDFGENAEKVVDGQIQKAEKALKDAEKMKVDYTAEPNDIMEKEALKKKTVEAAKKQLEHAQNIKKVMTAKKVAETVGKTEQTEGAHEAGSVAAQKFVNAPRLVGNKRTRMLPDGETKIKGHYEIVPAESLTPSHDVNNGYKKSEGFPTDAEGRTVNDRDYEHDKAAQQNTDQIARKYNGMAIEQVPVVSDEGIVYDGNGRTMAGQKAAKEGTDGEYINDLLENAENFGFTREQIEQSGIEHPRLVLVTDERLPYDTATFAKFNRNEKKTQSNTEQAVAKAKTLTSDEVGAIVAEIEGNGSLEAFFNNSKAINDLVKTLVDKGIIGQNEVAQMMDSPERLSAQGREYVKNLLLGSIFKPETIRMLGIDSTVKNKAINAIRSVMDNMKLGEFSLRDEIDQAIQLLYEARQGGNKVDTLLRTPDMYVEDAAKRYPSISQMMALALEGKVADFRDLLDEYNRIAAARNTGEGNVFGEAHTKSELIKEFLDFKKWQDYGTGHSENERGNDVSGVEEPQQEASGGNEPAEAERPRVEEADDLENKELESRIEVTDEETETPSKYGPIMKQKIVIDGDKEVMKVDEPNKKGEYTGSYYEYDGKKFGDLNEVTKYIDSKNEEGPLPLLPKKENPDPTFNPIEAAAAEFKKEHPLTEEEIMGVKDLDDESKYTAIDYLNGEDDSEIARICYEQAYNKAKGKKQPKAEEPKVSRDGIIIDDEVQSHDWSQYKKGDIFEYNGFKFQFKFVVRDEDGIVTGVAVQHLDENEKPIEHGGDSLPPLMFIHGFTKDTTKVEKPKTVEQKKADNKKFKEERDKETADLMSQFLAAANDRKDDGSSKALSTIVPIPSKALKWMDRHLTLTDKQKEILPKLLTAIKGSMYARIKEGVYNLEDVVERVRKDFDAFFGKIDKNDANKILAEAAYKGRYTDPETGERMKLSEFAERERKNTPKHQENLVGDSKDAEERKQKENSFINRIQTVLSMGEFKTGIAGMRKIAENCGLEGVKDTDLQELVETAIVGMARRYATSKAMSDDVKFAKIKLLYNRQPSLNQRDSERVMKQQYSTPAPYAFLADMYVKGNGKVIESALEPSAGNGMLTIGLPMDKVHVNDIDAQRLANLRRQGFKNVTSQDGTQPFADKDVDVVVTNPPFGSATPKEYDGYKISSLEGQMAINALESMKDDGRAAIIIGGKTEYAKNGSLNPKDKAFLGYLYSHYNVEDVINVDGSLFAKQGTTFPTRIILINGRRLNENAFPPVKDKARAETVKDYDELYKRIEDDIHQSAERGHGLSGDNRVQRPERGESNKPSVTAHDSAPNKERVRELGQRESLDKPSRNDRPHGAGMASESMVEKGGKANGGADGEIRPGDNGHKPGGMDLDEDKRRSDGGNVGGQRAEGLRGGDGSGNVAPRQRAKRQGLTTEKVQYVSKSRNPFSLHAVMPADQAEAVQKNLDKLGDVDQFLVDELGYNDKDDMYKALSSEQADSVALAINQMKQGNAFIIGDQTGIGKGRQGAALIRYAVKQGSVPVYLTQDAPLLSTVYRDTVDIGSKELRPFVIASDKKQAAITDQDGNLIYDLPSAAEKKRVFDYIKKYGKLPKEYDYVLTTYNQFASGTTDYENGERTSLKLNKGQRLDSPSRLLGQERRDVVEALMGNGYLILDECHNASGDSGIGHYFQHIVGKAKGVTFISATFAKRPDNMPIYAMRTAMSKAGMEASDLIEAIRTGGTTLQEIMSKTLTESGQMIRRERDMTGVSIDYVPMDEAGSVEEQKTKYDSIIDIFNDIIDFQKRFVDSYLDTRNEELADIQSTITNRKGTKALGIKNQPFASKTFNTVRQLLLGIKAPQAVKRAIECLEYQDEQSSEKGIKPIIFLENTMESNYKDDFENDVDMESPDFGTVLKKGLEGVLRYTQTDAKGKESKGSLSLADLGPEAEARYNEIMNHIAEVNSGMFISPIDYIKHELEKKGYRVGELTGREFEFVFNEDGTVRKQTRVKPNKKDVARKFNNGEIDVIIANKTGATGIDLHAGLKFNDQRPRRELILQNQLNIGDEVQAHGRADRTNQKYRGQYEYILSMIPAEQRLFMMLKSKLKSLYANTTSSQKSKFNEIEVADIINKYGDKVVANYLAEHLDIYSKLSDPLNWESTFGDDLSSIDPQKLIETKASGDAGSGASKTLQRMSLLKVSEQEKVIQEIGDLYANEIQRLNEMGENDLEITELPLKAKTLHKEVWKQGAEPGGDNAFADNTYIEKVNMAILKKPMKASEVKASQKGLTGGKTWEEYKTEKKAAVKEYFDQKIADETQRYEERAVKAATKAKEKYIKDGKKGQEKSGMTDEQIEKNAEYQYDTIYKQEKDKLDDVVKNLKEKAGMFDRVLDTFDTEQAFVLPTDMNNPNELSGFGNSYGRLIDIKITDNYSPNASSVSFATLDGRRKITFPIAGKVGSGENKADIIGAIDNMTKQSIGMGDSHLRVLNQNFDNWDRLTSNESRKNGYIVTGNLMQALVDSKDQGLGGQLVKYTTDTGEVKTGILMPDRFDPKGLTTDAPINSVADKFELSSWHGGIDEVTSSDGEVNVKRIDNYRGNFYELRVPKSKAKGGKYFMDEDLLKLVNGNNFETRGNNMLAEFKPYQLKPVLDRLSKMGVKVQEERKTSEDEGTHFREDHGDGNYPTSSVENHVEKVAQKTGANVNMVSSVDEITNKAAKAAIEEGRKITGWYDEKTGEVHLYMPNIHDRYTAEKTIWHEVVGHKGMRELFGDERFDKFLREVWYDLDKPENADLKKLVDEERKFNPLNIYDAIEEGIARLAEDGKGEAGFWNGIKNKVSDFLHEIGYRIAPNTKDVKYLLWLSKNLQKNPNDPYWKMRAEAVKYRLDHDRMPAVVAHDGMFYGNDGKVRSMDSLTKSEWDEATDGQIHFRTTPSAGTALDRYHRSLDEHGYMLTESYMDNMLSLKKLMNAIVPDKKIEDIASSENPYMLQNTMQGAMSNAAQMFERNVMKPLDKAMAGVLDAFDGKKDDEKIRNFNLYMITKHGLERNRVFFVRDFLRQMRMDEQKKQDADFLENSYYSDKEYLDNELNAGNIDLKEYYRQLDESIRNHFDADFEAGEHDYSGMHAIQEVAKSSDPYDDTEAIQSVMDSEAKMESIKKGSVKDYWNKVKAATQYSIDSDYKNNIIDKELHDYVSNMFNWYVPLRKYDEATAEDTYGYITELGDPKNYIGSTIMRARGHKYLSETNVLAQIGAMGNRAIKNGGLNAIKMAFARFARNNSNNNLITEVSVWYEKDPMTGIVYERYPDIPDDATPDEINQIVADFNTDMKAKAAQGLASKVYRRGSIGYKFQRAENKSQHIVDVKIAGRTHSFIINGNPRAAQALNGLLEHKNDTLVGRVAASISRNMAQLCTSYNPEFVMRNMIKDFEYASTNLLAKEGFRYTKLFEQYYAKVGIIEGIRNSKLKDLADTGGFGLFAKYRNGTLDTNDKVQRYFKEFMENGGETGWVQIKNMKDWTKEYKLHVKGERNKVQKVGKGFYNAIFKNLENINEIAENLARFATYCASRDSNRSVIRSVYDAKEVSTNFNRHGSGNAIYSFKNGEMGTGKTARKNIYGFTAAWFRNSSMFFNAGIQSTNLLIKNFKNNKAGTIGYIASAPFISGMAMALLNNFIISNEDEKDRNGVKDPYAELPDYIRRNNLCVYIGGGEFVTIPLAIEERAFYGLGDFAAGMTFSKNISSQKMPNLTENKDIDKYLNPFMDAVGCMSQLVPVADYLGNASFGKHPVQETIKAVAPSATSPFLEWVYNSDWKGAPIQRDNKFDENQPSWMLAYKGTPEWMINMNKKVNALTNDVAPGNEDMKGNDFLDEVTNPSALHHFYGSYFGGAATFVERVGGLIKNGKDTETKDIPFLRSLLYTPNEQSSLQRTKSKWYNYKDEMEKTMANVDRLKSKNVPLDKRITNIGEYYQFQNSKEAAKVRVIELAEKQMERWKKMRDKASDTESINFANQNIDRIMMDAVDDLDKLN